MVYFCYFILQKNLVLEKPTRFVVEPVVLVKLTLLNGIYIYRVPFINSYFKTVSNLSLKIVFPMDGLE